MTTPHPQPFSPLRREKGGRLSQARVVPLPVRWERGWGEGRGRFAGRSPTSDAYLVCPHGARLNCRCHQLAVGWRHHPSHHHRDERYERRNRRHVHSRSSFDCPTLWIAGEACIASARRLAVYNWYATSPCV